ncbi:hypothetical protein [Sulfurimonas xiamenensis]|uniref:Uncharacterized protein n=1 Tax=Sulfurimonas xiamenensis TaxID=2590021 RepID=A0AAJ4A561_9BACT|nr:hypothetical protein [Sulfurimonas xiamenensis]QFR44057.1 hypothetical protein FJR47_09060 [Sulfurimonas xiamenensis]
MEVLNLYVSEEFEEKWENIKNDIWDLKFELQKELTNNDLDWDSSQFEEIMEVITLLNEQSEKYPR